MPIISFLPLRWDWSSFAKIKDLRPDPPHPYISNKIARDIGLDPDDLAAFRHQWPSQGTDRCRL
jgi:hypothetical protein